MENKETIRLEIDRGHGFLSHCPTAEGQDSRCTYQLIFGHNLVECVLNFTFFTNYRCPMFPTFGDTVLSQTEIRQNLFNALTSRLLLKSVVANLLHK